MRIARKVLVTLGVMVLAAVAAATVARGRFDRQVDAEVQALVEQAMPAGAPTVEAAELRGLPAPVQRWLERSGVVGRERARMAG